MKVLVANLGSTSFKYCLFAMTGTSEQLLAKGGYERVEDFGAVIQDALESLICQGHLQSVDELDAVGFKTVLGKNLSGCVRADETVLEALDGMAFIAPAHNPAYAAGIRQFWRLTKAHLVALFETSFYQWTPEATRRYAVPEAWYQLGIRRYGFHGASHKFIAERSAQLLAREDVAERARNLYTRGPGASPEKPLRVISCHLGGSSSVTGILSGVAIGNSMGLSPQSGLPQNNRVGDLDSMALPMAANAFGLSVSEACKQLSKEGGLLGLSGVSNDVRDIAEAARSGNDRAQLALDVFVHAVRHWMGAYMLQMGGVDAIVFTGGIGENRGDLRNAICAGLEEFGIKIDPESRELRARECALHSSDSRVSIFIIPANEETVVARETYRLLSQ
ncbi:MAG: acetate kinase [Verrucomicrobia bacterium]|nr:acetate kinase [Verrucomicrobiota bacterium]